VHSNFNWLLGTIIDKINELLQRGPMGHDPDQSATIDPAVLSRYIPTGSVAGSSQAFDSANVIEGGSDKAYVGMCAYWDTTADPGSEAKILVLDGTTERQIDVVNVATMTIESNSGDLGGGKLPSGSSEIWVPQAMCTDGAGYVYVTFIDTNASPKTHLVQAYAVSNWAVRSGWGTGTALPGTGDAPQTFILGDVRQVTATQIATTNPWTTISGATDAVTIIGMSDGVIDASGEGDATSNYACRLTSDGTYIFFTNYLAKEVNSLEIATPANGCGGSNWPLDLGTANPMDVFNIGNSLITTYVDTNGGIYWGDSSEAELSTCATTDKEVISLPGSIAFDGTNVWVKGTMYAGASTSKVSFFKLQTGYVADDGIPDLDRLVRSGFMLNPEYNWANYNTTLNPIIFDGRDIWSVGDYAAGQTLSGKIYRLPNAVLR
jgi:hypothetical protein